MEKRIKVLTKKDVVEYLKAGCILRYNNLSGLVHICNKSNIFDVVGSVRFDTFLKIRSEMNLKELHSNNAVIDNYSM